MKNRVITISGVLGINKCADIIAELFCTNCSVSGA